MRYSSLNRLNIKSNTGRGALYGAFHLINMIQRDASTLPSSVTKITVKKTKSQLTWELWIIWTELLRRVRW